MQLIETPGAFLSFESCTKRALVRQCAEEVDSRLEHHPPIRVFGRECRQRRDVGFFSDTSIGYRYSSQIMKAQPLTGSMPALLDYVNQHYKTRFNGILVNAYEPTDSIGDHSDDEKGIDQKGVVCISFGAERILRIRNKATKKLVKDIPLPAYSMIHMGGAFQQEFTHGIPIQSRSTGRRISFTFRNHSE